MTIQIIRQYGRPVPDWAQDPNSDEYILWCKLVLQIEDDEFSVVHKPECIVGVGQDGQLILRTVEEEGVWQVK